VWYGIVAPKGTPPEIVETLNAAVNAVLADPKLEARLVQLGGVPMPMTPAPFGTLLAGETEKGAKGVKLSRANPDGSAKNRVDFPYRPFCEFLPGRRSVGSSTPHHGVLQPGDREIHHGRDDREDGDRGGLMCVIGVPARLRRPRCRIEGDGAPPERRGGGGTIAF